MIAHHPVSVVLINPPISQAQREGPLGPLIRNLYFNSPPLGIAYIAAVLEKDGFKVHIIDAAVEDYTMSQTVDAAEDMGADIVGITSGTNFFCNALELANEIKTRRPDIKTILGGPHVTTNCDSAMKHECFDVACIGEGEVTCLELVHALSEERPLDNVKGIAFRADGTIRKTESRPLIDDLDALPLPARHLLPIHKYVPQPNDGPYLPKTAMISSRGCPYGCIFCDHGVHGNTYRSLSAGRIIDEMEDVVSKYGIRDIAFVDSLSMVSVERMEGICEEILARKLKVHWTCTIRANIATRDILKKMKAAGCWRARVGIEAGNERILKLIGKHITKEEIRKVVREADQIGLRPKGFFMLGHPGETRDTIEESIAFAKSLPLTDITVQINTPLPGTPQWATIQDHGTLITQDLKHYSFWEPVFVPEGLTEEDLRELHGKFYREFYFRPSIIWRHLKMIRSINDIIRYARALSLMIGMFVTKRPKPQKA